MLWLLLGIVIGVALAVVIGAFVLPNALRRAMRQSLPSFCLGANVPEHEAVPVVMYHVVHRHWFEPEIDWLTRNGYETITPDLLVDWLTGKAVTLPRRPIVLTFDDAHRSVYTDAFPVLQARGMTGITFVCPWWIREARDENAAPAANWHAHPLGDCATWSELHQMQQAGVIDAQAHTFAHQQIWVDGLVRGFVRPAEPCRYVSFGDAGSPPTQPNPPLGWPILTHCSRFAARPGFRPDETVMQRCAGHVEANGGAEFFTRPSWRDELRRVIDPGAPPGATLRISGTLESPQQQRDAMRRDLQRTRDVLSDKLNTDIRHLCFPWNEASSLAVEIAREVGYVSAFRRMINSRDVNRIGDDPMHIVRFKSHEPQPTVRCLPGRDRISIFTLLRHTALHGLRRRLAGRHRAMPTGYE